jgi:hypothetical protein
MNPLHNETAPTQGSLHIRATLLFAFCLRFCCRIQKLCKNFKKTEKVDGALY